MAGSEALRIDSDTARRLCALWVIITRPAPFSADPVLLSEELLARIPGAVDGGRAIGGRHALRPVMPRQRPGCRPGAPLWGPPWAPPREPAADDRPPTGNG